jgi:hypothetical protein
MRITIDSNDNVIDFEALDQAAIDMFDEMDFLGESADRAIEEIVGRLHERTLLEQDNQVLLLIYPAHGKDVDDLANTSNKMKSTVNRRIAELAAQAQVKSFTLKAEVYKAAEQAGLMPSQYSRLLANGMTSDALKELFHQANEPDVDKEYFVGHFDEIAEQVTKALDSKVPENEAVSVVREALVTRRGTGELRRAMRRINELLDEDLTPRAAAMRVRREIRSRRNQKETNEADTYDKRQNEHVPNDKITNQENDNLPDTEDEYVPNETDNIKENEQKRPHENNNRRNLRERQLERQQQRDERREQRNKELEKQGKNNDNQENSHEDQNEKQKRSNENMIRRRNEAQERENEIRERRNNLQQRLDEGQKNQNNSSEQRDEVQEQLGENQAQQDKQQKKPDVEDDMQTQPNKEIEQGDENRDSIDEGQRRQNERQQRRNNLRQRLNENRENKNNNPEQRNETRERRYNRQKQKEALPDKPDINLEQSDEEPLDKRESDSHIDPSE